MRLLQLAKDADSGQKNCPSVHDDLDGTDFVLVGPTVDSSPLSKRHATGARLRCA